MAASIDFKRELRAFYRPSSKAFSIVDVPELQFLKFDGHGDPNTAEEYQVAIQALYAVAYTIRFAKKAEGLVYTVMPLEGLWCAGDMGVFGEGDKSAWDWTMMIMQPEAVTQADLNAARETVARKKPEITRLEDVRLETYAEGAAVQIMYTGPYDDEHETIMAMHAHAEEQGYHLEGKHHEIYLSDPRRTAPEKLKTVLRQPIRK